MSGEPLLDQDACTFPLIGVRLLKRELLFVLELWVVVAVAAAEP